MHAAYQSEVFRPALSSTWGPKRLGSINIPITLFSKLSGLCLHLQCKSYSGGLPRWLSSRESSCQAGDARSIPGIPGEGNGSPLQYSCLKNPMDRGVWRATVHGVSKSQTYYMQLQWTGSSEPRQLENQSFSYPALQSALPASPFLFSAPLLPPTAS